MIKQKFIFLTNQAPFLPNVFLFMKIETNDKNKMLKQKYWNENGKLTFIINKESTVSTFDHQLLIAIIMNDSFVFYIFSLFPHLLFVMKMKR